MLIFIENRVKLLADVPEMIYGKSPTDGGNLYFYNRGNGGFYFTRT